MGKIRPIMVKGHERALTMIKYNRDGDLLFSCSKDHVPSLWYSENGERIGTYHGHCGTVWCLDVNCTPRALPAQPAQLVYAVQAPALTRVCCDAQGTAHCC